VHISVALIKAELPLLGLLSSSAELNDYYWADEIKEDKWMGGCDT